jgi:DtxR family transcriptional regulator, Mn-dependent transcriptional regulator
MAETRPGRHYRIMGVSDHSPVFLKYLEKHKLTLGTDISVRSLEEVDGSRIIMNKKKEIAISEKVAACIICQAID